ncbi:hypothetical protein ACLIYM_25375 [Streptomyces fenghuangensis]
MQPALSTPRPMPAFDPVPLPADRDPELALPPADPDGCRWCSDPADGHGLQWHPAVGRHGWEEPTVEQRQARRTAHNRRAVEALREVA